ncbi:MULTISPECIES: cytochrome c-type biogenesis protein [unclassified Polynucleobacter]|jgi:cytochrome c-type biogenesis protein CcmH|uniref:cytochrome c-type biogenesis protein n=1 Tax=unclassified Polynucleobacter TaxID=2640945 RepID=UPI00092A5DEC|nr:MULTISPECIES: cytochrome c-type biogenesis protein [unclassified Polynucleobacter]MBU3562590.1 cytochrome c-type biogenesis protein CcmH [Polynucleobacter sp. Tro8-14-1]MEA9568657.1 cytochrome c-type biogenesis protein [Polynucleobacter sp. AP-Nickl1-40-C4]OJI04435.1 cytochrome C biogenesis protein CcmH [Polynucleobacter sp. MWH-Adler-W8]
MRRILLIAVCVFSLGNAFAKDAAPLADDPITEQRLISISEEMRCLVCQNESLAGSRSDLANDLRREIRVLIKEGKSDDQIRSFMVERYGDFVLYRPPVKPLTWLLWIGPFVILGLGVAGLLMYLRRRDSSVPNVALTDADNQKIDALLNASDKKEG